MSLIFEKGIQELSQLNSNWDDVLTSFLDDKNDTNANKEQREVIKKFTELLDSIIEEANRSRISVDKVESLFDGKKCEKYAKSYIKRKMQTYDSFKALRDLDNKDRIKAKFCVDLIWDSNIIRYDPNIDFETQNLIEEKEYNSVVNSLDLFTDTCVVHSLCVSAICKELEKESGLSNEMCKYIAEKIDNDFEKLKLNYIIEKLTYGK